MNQSTTTSYPVLDSYCNDTFWDWKLTWDTDDPDFTTCFERTVLVWVPCTFLWLMASVSVYGALNSRSRNIPWTALNVTKSGITVLLMIIQLCDLAYSFISEGNGAEVPSVDRYTPIIKILTLGLSFFLLFFDKIKGVRASGVQFLFWLLHSFCEAFYFRTVIRKSMGITGVGDAGPIDMVEKEDVFPYVLQMVYFPLVVGMFLLNCWADADPLYQENTQILERPCPESKASFLSRILFFWFESLAWKGYKKSLEFTDLWDLNQEDKSKSLVPVFDKYWNRSLEKAKNVPDSRASFQKKTDNVDIKSKTKKGGKQDASILPTLCKAFGPTFLVGAFLKFIQDLLTFVSPQILSLLISFVDKENKESAWKGYFYAVLLLVTTCVQTLVLSQYFHRMFLVGMRIRTSLVSAIYKKALRISNTARKETTVGEIVNLMSVDAQRFMDLTAYLNMLWSAPLQIALSLYFLWQTLGPSVLAGLGVMILLIPVNAVIASKVKKFQIRQMKYKDERVKLMNEILSGIKVLKLYAWEPSFQDQVMKIRGKEIKVLKDAAYLNAGTSFIWTCAPFLVSVVTFATYVLMDEHNVLDAQKAFVALSLFNLMRMPMNMLPAMIVLTISVAVVTFATYVYTGDSNILTAKRAFVSLAYFNILRFPLSMLPMIMSSVIQASVSLKRLNKYMNAEEIDPNAVSHDNFDDSAPIVVDNGTFSWDDETTTLKNINMKIKEGSLVAVVGPVGSGKSSLLSAILGEMEKQTGRVNTRGVLAYVAQQAWIQNATLKENILFGRPYDPTKYDKVVDSCALKPDLEILPAGDKTEIGEKGINLSGGQKQRVSLARATYFNADVYLLDDPLSAVDSHVGKHIFDCVLGPNGILGRKTRVLVTHGITYLPQVDHIIVMKDGEISEFGTYKELLEKKGAFAEFLLHHIGNEDIENTDAKIIQDLEVVIGSTEVLARQRSRLSESEGQSDRVIQRQMSTVSQLSYESGGKSTPQRKMSKTPDLNAVKENGVKEKLIEAEKAETGSVKFDVYMHYLRAVGWSMTLWVFVLHLVFQGFSVGSNVWLSAWSNEPAVNGTQDPSTRDLYLGVYAGLGIGQAIAIMVASVVMALGTLRAASRLHLHMLNKILKAPMSFFDTTPIGRIVNRFAKDVDVVDSSLVMNLRSFLNCFFSVIATLVVISYSTPIFIAVILPTGVLYYMVQRFYVATSRQLKRLESVSRSPIYSHFGETITGSSTIRAYGMEERFILESEAKVDHNQISYYPSIVSNRWLAIRLEFVGNLIIFSAALFAVLGRETLSPGLVGLSVSYALQITQTLNWLVRMTSDVETNIVAVERIKEYGEAPQEAEWEVNERKPSKSWPESGKVMFEHYKSRYREGLDLVLKDVTCEINPGEKIGIVGRTGAGKSSLTLGLFRIVEAAGGKIIIDGQDISKLGLHDLRSRLTIIPQDPVLFSGNLRMNLDPFEYYTDEAIWRSLELAHLKSFVKGLSAGLEHEINEGGENLSVGQRQLVCLARALLRKTKILILDEATAAVDLETDELIQQTIKSEFKECTVLTIAHRLNTIMDSNRVIVLDKGEIREVDSPDNLLKNRKSIFYGMAKDAGLA